MLDFSASINPLGHPPGLRKRLNGLWDQILHYPDRNCSEFRSALARKFALPTETIAVGNGSAELIDVLLRAVSPTRLILSPPDFGLYESLAPSCSQIVRVARVEAERFQPDFPRLSETLRPGDAVLLSNPGNPSGHVVRPVDLIALLERADAAGAHLIVDEAFADFCPEVSLLPLTTRYSSLVVLRSLTKFYGIPGLRLGFLGAAPEMVRRVADLQVPWSVSTVAQAAGVYCLGAAGWEETTLTYVDRHRTELSQGLTALPGLTPLPSAANYLLVRLDPPAPPARELYEKLAMRGLLVRHCGSFGLGERYIRVAVRRPEENARLLGALTEILLSPAPQPTATTGPAPVRTPSSACR
jgi:threonine-phosphate decarboxylase